MLVFCLGAHADAEEYRGLSATTAACRMPMKAVKRHLRDGTLEARGLPAVILRTRLFFSGGAPESRAVRAFKAAANAPVASMMQVSRSPDRPVYDRGATARQRPAAEAVVTDLTTTLVQSLRGAKGSAARAAILGQHAASGFDRNALGRLLRAHRPTRKGSAPIVFATDAFKAQPRSGGNMVVASGGQDVHVVMDHPKQLLTKGRVGFTLVGGQPRTANMGPTAGSSVAFQVDRQGRISNVDVVGRGDLLLLSLSSQLGRDIRAKARTGSRADPQDLMAIVNHAAPALLQRMVTAPKPARLFGPMPEWVPFSK
jgi:hypothetical protein